MELGTKEFNDSAMEMFGGKPKQETAVEWLCKQYHLKQDIEIVKQAKEMEKEQLECAWNSSDQNMRFQFSSSAYKAITFKKWLEQFKQEK